MHSCMSSPCCCFSMHGNWKHNPGNVVATPGNLGRKTGGNTGIAGGIPAPVRLGLHSPGTPCGPLGIAVCGPATAAALPPVLSSAFLFLITLLSAARSALSILFSSSESSARLSSIYSSTTAQPSSERSASFSSFCLREMSSVPAVAASLAFWSAITPRVPRVPPRPRFGGVSARPTAAPPRLHWTGTGSRFPFAETSRDHMSRTSSEPLLCLTRFLLGGFHGGDAHLLHY